MKVIVDTTVWSEALRRRRRRDESVAAELSSLIDDHRVILLGPVRQEMLSGIRHKEQYESLRSSLRSYPDPTIETEDYELGAEFYNRCRARGIQASLIDMLISAVAARLQACIFTLDRDFEGYSRLLPITLHKPTAR